MSAVVAVDGLQKSFRLTSGHRLVAVAGVSFQIQRGEVLGLIGESGSGKSTVGRCLAGLLGVDHGTITWDQADSTVGMVFQEPRQSLNRRFQLWEAIADPLLATGMRLTRELADRVENAASSVGLSRANLLMECGSVSDELLQRASLARALIRDPDLLILDEPTTALDPDARAGVLELIQQLREQSNTAILLISHDLLAVRSVTSRVAIMYLGKIVERGPTDRLFGAALHPYTRALMESALELDPNIPLTPVELSGEIPNPMDRPSGCPLEPRCPWALAECGHAYPEDQHFGTDHTVACIRASEFAGGSALLGPGGARSRFDNKLGPDRVEMPGAADRSADESDR